MRFPSSIPFEEDSQRGGRPELGAPACGDQHPFLHGIGLCRDASFATPWGELIALRPRHIDFLRKTVTVEETIVEVSRKHSPTGDRYVVKPYPKDNEPRTFGVDEDWLAKVALHIQSRDLNRDQLLFTTTAGTPISRNTFRTRAWLPAVAASGTRFKVRVHDLRHAHASWLLDEGSDLKSVMDRVPPLAPLEGAS